MAALLSERVLPEALEVSVPERPTAILALHRFRFPHRRQYLNQA